MHRKSAEEMKGMKRNVREVYESQNEILVRLRVGSNSGGRLGFLTPQQRIKDGFTEVDEILDNTRASDKTGELGPLLPVRRKLSTRRARADQC